jgi:hypothetical protein
LHEISFEIFKMFDVNGDGVIEPGELSHMMFLMGEVLEPDEVGRMFAECERWCQPVHTKLIEHRSAGQQQEQSCWERLDRCYSRRVERSNPEPCVTRKDSVTIFRTQGDNMPFEPASIKLEADLGKMQISQEEFMVMLTEYWTCRKFGETSAAARGPFKRHSGDATGLRDDIADIKFSNPAALKQVKASAIPPPPWMLELGSGHSPISQQFREPAVFWYYLVRKMEQLMTTKNASGMDDATVSWALVIQVSAIYIQTTETMNYVPSGRTVYELTNLVTWWPADLVAVVPNQERIYDERHGPLYAQHGEPFLNALGSTPGGSTDIRLRLRSLPDRIWYHCRSWDWDVVC